MTSATLLQLSISCCWPMWFVLCEPAPWLAAMHWVAVAAACLDAFSSLLIIFLFMVVETAWEVVFLKVSAALFSASWLDGSDPSALTACAASTILAVASANSLAADRSRFCGGCVSSVLSQLESGNMKNRERKKIVYLVKCGVIIMKEWQKLQVQTQHPSSLSQVF